ncbi:MAG: hypothetical protein Q8P02_01935, partial [Candidatus Micrarchaeota archaeon]|nr:hypothetical protein [Candidatus Micrarchaeota archaeon]
MDAAGIAAMSLVLVHFAGSQVRQGMLAISRPEWLVMLLVATGILAAAACLVLDKTPAAAGKRKK